MRGAGNRVAWRRWGGLTVAAGLAALTLVACGGGEAEESSDDGGDPLVVAILQGFTGKFAAFGEFVEQGTQIAVDEINASGGVLGRKLEVRTGDTGSNPVQAVPALQQLLTSKPAMILGPTSVEFPAVRNLINSNSIPNFAYIPSTTFDNITDKWVFSIGGSDSDQSRAMAYYALDKKLTRCALIFDNTAPSQSIKTPIKETYERHGGTVVADVLLTPGASSYRSEIQEAFANDPQCVFMQLDDPQTNGTFFSNVRQLGHLDVPFVGSDVFIQPQFVEAAGPEASKKITGAAAAVPEGPSWDRFVEQYTAKHDEPPNHVEAYNYDAVVVAALAMTAADTTDGKAWRDKVLTVVNEPGTPVTEWAEGKKLLEAGEEISYIGASGLHYFEPKHQRITSGWSIVRLESPDADLETVFTVTSEDLEGY